MGLENSLSILQARPIDGGIIRVCTNGCSIGFNGEMGTRPLGEVELVLLSDIDPRKRNLSTNPKEPIRVLGLRETGSEEALSVEGDGFINHPLHSVLCTPAYASSLIPLGTYLEYMRNIETAYDLLEVRDHLIKYFRSTQTP